MVKVNFEFYSGRGDIIFNFISIKIFESQKLWELKSKFESKTNGIERITKYLILFLHDFINLYGGLHKILSVFLLLISNLIKFVISKINNFAILF